MNIKTLAAALSLAILCIPAVGDARTYVDKMGREVFM